MPQQEVIERAQRDKEEGKSPSTQAGEFVREERHHIREGKHGAVNAKQAIAIGLQRLVAQEWNCRSRVKLVHTGAPPQSNRCSRKSKSPVQNTLASGVQRAETRRAFGRFACKSIAPG
jgi:hypothetical protein